jgi:hypothetical protein
MSGDVRGYYAALGLEPGAPIDTVKNAFRKLAKECHPDMAHVRDGGLRFRQLSEAYEILSDSQLKTAYDQSSAASPPPPEDVTEESSSINPIACDVCGKFTAQPRRLAFWRVTSFILASHKTPVQKIFCQSCALKEQWTSTIWTSLLGWWGIPWGPVWSIAQGATNALGGSREIEVDERMMWQNALAFASSGQGALAIGLGNILRKSENAELARHSADLIRFFGERGFDTSTTFKDVWGRSPLHSVALFATAFALPGAAIAYALLDTSLSSAANWNSTAQVGASPAMVDDPLQNIFGPEALSEETTNEVLAEPTEPTCEVTPANGEILADNRETPEAGHVLEIDNGTEGDAIVKLRNASTDTTLASFFVGRGQSASIRQIPDGIYRIQYAFGSALAADCKSFVRMASAGEFPDSETFATRYEQELAGTRVIRGHLSYTLYATPGGNVAPDRIDPAEFNKP